MLCYQETWLGKRAGVEGKSSVGTVGMVLNVDGDGSIVGDGSGSPIFCSAVQI